MVRMCALLCLPDPQLEAVPPVEDVETQAEPSLERLLRWWRVPLAAVEDAAMEPEVYTPGMCDWTDAMLEHAVTHPGRHNFQLPEMPMVQCGERLGVR